MRLQPRSQILDVWQAVARFSTAGARWNWGEPELRNSISDAERLLCLMGPAGDVPNLALDVPDATAEDVLEALRPFGDSVEIPKLLIDVISDYLATYVSDSGRPVFAGDRYFQPSLPGTELTTEQRALDVVDSYAASVSLALSTLGFLNVFAASVRRDQLKQKIAEVAAATSRRLSAAMVGLLRGFCVNVFEPDSPQGRTLVQTLNQSGLPDRLVLADLNRALRSVRAGLRDASLGKDNTLDDENMLFECGWSWGVVRGAPVVETTEPIGEQPDGVAGRMPHLYFTVFALYGITDLFSDRTRILGLLNPEQQRLAQALQVRWDITRVYWSAIARLGHARWPLEDVPWRTTGEEESPYFSLLVSAVVLLDLLVHRATDDDLNRTVAVLEELAIRGRINRRVMANDNSGLLHWPGIRLELVGAEELGPGMSWMVSDFAALLLNRATRAASLARNTATRERFLTVAQDTLAHLWRRRITHGPAAGLWDDPSELIPGIQVDPARPSWSLTERVLEGLVIGAGLLGQRPIRSLLLLEITTDLLSEADHLLSQELLQAAETHPSAIHTSLHRMQARLQRARRILQEQPGTAHALVADVLRGLDDFGLARRDAARSL